MAEAIPPPPLPDDRTLLELLDASYQASLVKEEGRPVRFSILWVPVEGTTATEKEASDLRDEPTPDFPYKRYPHVDLKLVVEFEAGRPFSSSELVRLSPATDPWNTYIIVLDGGMLDGASDWTSKYSGSMLTIAGLYGVGETAPMSRRDEAALGGPIPNDLLISVWGSGWLTVGRLGQVFVTLREGTVRPMWGSFFGTIDKLLDRTFMGVVAEARAYVAETVSAITGEHVQKSVTPTSRDLTTLLRRLVHQVVVHGHGGMIVLVDDKVRAVEACMAQVAVKYPCNADPMWDFILRLSVLREDGRRHWLAWTDRQARPSERLSDRAEIDQLRLWITESLRFLGRLTQVDGCVILTNRMRLLGFGAEVRVTKSEEGVEVMFVDGAGRSRVALLESFGTRHRSAYRICRATGATVIVVSQDGGVRIVRREGTRVLFFEDVLEGRFL